MHLTVSTLKAAINNAGVSQSRKDDALSQLRAIASNPADPRNPDAASVLTEILGDDACTENRQRSDSLAEAIAQADPVNIPDSYEFKVSSSYVRCCILLGMADEEAAKAGKEPSAYENDEVRATVGCWYEGWKRAKTVSKFWDLFDRILSPKCKTLLGFNEISRPSEAVTV